MMPRGRVRQFTPEELKARRQAREKAHYQKNREKVIARVQARYYANLGKEIPSPKPKLTPEERLARKRELDRAKSKLYRAKHGSVIDKRDWTNRKKRMNEDINYLFRLAISASKNRAKTAGKEHNIDIAYLNHVWEEQQGLCNLTKIKMAQEVNSPNKVSIDRIDSNLGYIKGNIQLVTGFVNKAKLDMTQAEFISMCKAVAENNK